LKSTYHLFDNLLQHTPTLTSEVWHLRLYFR